MHTTQLAEEIDADVLRVCLFASSTEQNILQNEK